MAPWRPELAEALGVFLMLAVGGAAALGEARSGGIGPLGVALAFAFAIMVLVAALGPVSGAHFNPAVTIAFAATGHFPWRRVPAYVVAQLAGAVAAALALRALLGDVAPLATHLAPGVEPLSGLGAETLATFLLGLVIVAVATRRPSDPIVAGLAIGLTVGLGILAVGSLTGASMNPARSFGPALLAGAWGDLWLYVAGPVTGAMAGMAAFEALRGDRAQDTQRQAVEPDEKPTAGSQRSPGPEPGPRLGAPAAPPAPAAQPFGSPGEER